MESKLSKNWLAASGWIAFLSTLLAWGLLSHPHSPVETPSQEPYNPDREKMIVLDAENHLLKQMLGQVQGKLFLLSAAPNSGNYYGKLVWDESRQAGFIITTALPPLPQGKVYKVFVRSEKQFYSQSKGLTLSEDGNLQCMFDINKPIFKASEFRIAIDDPSVSTPPKDYLLIGR